MLMKSCIYFRSEKHYFQMQYLQRKTKKCGNQSSSCGLTLLELGKQHDKTKTISIRDGVQWSKLFYFSNPTPESSQLPKWHEAKEFPVNYYRLGNLNFDSKPMFGTEKGGIFEERAKFWRELGTHLLSSKPKKTEL